MSDDENFLEDLLRRNDFLVKVVLLDTGMLAVDYTANKQVIYSVLAEEKSSNSEIIYNIKYEYNGVAEEFVLSGPVVRLFILMDIYKECRRLGLPNSIVRIYNKEGAISTLMDILPLELSPGETKQEKILNSAMERVYNKPEMINQLDDKLEKAGLLKSFTLLKGLFV